MTEIDVRSSPIAQWSTLCNSEKHGLSALTSNPTPRLTVYLAIGRFGGKMPPHECGIDRPVRVSLTSLAGSATEVGAGAFYFDAHECCAGEDPLHRLSQATL